MNVFPKISLSLKPPSPPSDPPAPSSPPSPSSPSKEAAFKTKLENKSSFISSPFSREERRDERRESMCLSNSVKARSTFLRRGMGR